MHRRKQTLPLFFLIFILLISLVTCTSTDERPENTAVVEEGGNTNGRFGQWEIDVSRANHGEGYTVAWVPTQGEPVQIGVNLFGWLADATWTPPDNIGTICPQGTTVVQMIIEFKHTWKANLAAEELNAVRNNFPDRQNEIDQPKAANNPTYSGSGRLPGGSHKSADAPGVMAFPASALEKLEAKFETCVVCKGTWQPLDCFTWGFVADYTITPFDIDGIAPEFGAASPVFSNTLNDFVN